jgi:flavin-dependent dehydrogenase
LSQQGGVIPYDLKSKIAFNNILLLGDSACQVKATTGGGIVMLLNAAKYAAYGIKKCFNLGDYSSKTLKRYYEKQCKATIGKQLKIHYLIRKILEYFTEKDYDTFFNILKSNEIESEISIYGDMDFPRKLVLRLIKNGMILKFLVKFFIFKPKLLLKTILIILKY